MRIACPVDENQMIAETLAVAKAFMLFDTEEDEILSMETITPLYEKVVSVLASHLVDTVICRNLDIKDMIDLSRAEIEIVGGAKGKAKSCVLQYINGTLECDDITCPGASGSCSGDCSHCR